jgi:hypothetical protein
MYKKIFQLVLFINLLGCSKADNKDQNPVVADCPRVESFGVVQISDELKFSITNSNTVLFYEVSYVNSLNNPIDPKNGQKFTFNTLTLNKNIGSLSLEPGDTFLFYARAICLDGSKSSWTPPISLMISSYCDKPSNLRFEFSPASESFFWDFNSKVAYSQVQYGKQNFVLGTGTFAQVTNNYYDQMSMEANTNYDFYVRSFCNNSNSWSSWSGPHTHLSTRNQNICIAPTNLSYIIESIGSNTTFFSLQWDADGNKNFEISVVLNGYAPDSVNYQSFVYTGAGWPVLSRTKNKTYDFYVRTVCKDGTKTNWAGPKNITL